MRHFLLIFLLFTACESRKPKALLIATAANVQFAMEELTGEFSKTTGIRCETVLSSSGKLTTQIMEGAPFDVFISADMSYPEQLFKNGLTTGPPEVYAYGKLVLWTMRDGLDPSLDMLAGSAVRHVAIANPKTAPYGAAAVEVLENAGIFEKIKPKLVYGESISQTNQFIISKTADAGFTAKSVVLSPEMKDQGRWVEIEAGTYAPIAQGAVLLKNSGSMTEAAEAFYRFLFSENAKTILKKYGYDTP